MRKGEIDLNQYKNIVEAALFAALTKTNLGSLAEDEAGKLYSRLRHEKYCVEHGIVYEDMTEDDFVNEYLSAAGTEAENEKD